MRRSGCAVGGTVRRRRPSQTARKALAEPADGTVGASVALPLNRPFGWRQAVSVYAAFAAGVVVVTWPLVLSPATLWPPHHDPRVFAWVMASMARRLVSAPLALFHGNAFYPAGASLAFTEPLLPPSLLGLPGFLWGNPILTYNLLLLSLWPLNGLAMTWVARALTGSRAAGWLAGAVFCLSPYFTEYYLEFQMLLAALLPVVLLAWVRWLETADGRWLVAALGGFTLQGVTTWYYTVILGLGLVTLTVAVLCLRWGGWAWRRRAVSLILGGLAVGAVLLPFALPYLAVHREFSYERSVREAAGHYADVLSFIEPGGRSPLYSRFAPTGHIAETSPFVGFSVLALAAGSLVWLRQDRPGPASALWLGRALLTALGATLGTAAWLASRSPSVVKYRLGPLALHLRPGTLLDLAVVLGIALFLVRGWVSRRQAGRRPLSPGEWVRSLLLLTGVLGILALGPIVHVARRAVGPGPYLGLYDVLFPLHVVRTTTRFAVLTVAGLALLAAFGVRALEDGLRSRPGLRRLAVAGIFVALALEYAVAPAPYEEAAAAPRPVDVVLRADPAEVAVLEWPTNVADSDADAMVRSLYHEKLLVNGLSGVVPWFIADLSARLTSSATPFPAPEAQAALRRIYPLRYLVVRLRDLTEEWRPVWQELRHESPPLLRFVGSFGSEDLYRVEPLPEQGVQLQRWVSHDFLRRHSILEAALRPRLSTPDLDQEVEVQLNGRPVEWVPINDAATASVTLAPPFFKAIPNVVTLAYRYRRPASALDARYRIGRTGTTSPGDLRVVSAGGPPGEGSIQLDGVELSPARRGYNLVALDSTGRPVKTGTFDTALRADASERLARWVASLPPRTIVAGAVRDDASSELTAAAVRALSTLGVAGDLRGRFRDAHAFVGVTDAAPGSAVEALGPRAVEVTVGRRESPPGFELTGFALRAPR